MIEVTILIPIADNSGDTFTPSHHRVFEAFVLDRFGGLTRATGTVGGLWVDDKRVFEDQLIVFLIAVESILDGGKLREVTDFAKGHYRQEALFLRYLGVAEVV